MENAVQKEGTDASTVSVIGANIIITGNIETSADPRLVDLQIEGRVIGDIKCATLILGETSSVKGSIVAERVRVSGTIDGGVDTTDLAIEASARVSGDISYERLRIANGGIIQGSVKWKGAEKQGSDGGKLKLVGTSSNEKAAVYID